MANSIEAVRVMADALDELFVRDSVTSVLEGSNDLIKYTDNAKTVYIPDLQMDGLGDYDRATGFPEGDVNLTYTPYDLKQDRGREFSIDSVTNDEAADVFGKVASRFEKQKVVPEVDSYRLSKLLANAKTVNVNATIDKTNALTLFTKASTDLFDLDIDLKDCIAFVSSEMYAALATSDSFTRTLSQAEIQVGNITLQVKAYNEMPIVVVPQARFWSNYEFNSLGFTKTDGAVGINFMIVHRNSAIAIKKHERIRVFSPEVNQDKDAWKFQYRLFHDIITPKNKQIGIYASVKGTYTATLNADGSNAAIAEIEATKKRTA